MIKADVRCGAIVRVTKDRWDAAAGTLAEVDSVRHARRLEEWCFTVGWHRSPPNKRAVHRDHSINLFESDLADLEIFTGSLPSILVPQRQRGRAIMSRTPSPQLGLPYTAHDYISDRLNLEGFPRGAAPYHIQVAATVGYNTGMRKGENPFTRMGQTHRFSEPLHSPGTEADQNESATGHLHDRGFP